MRTNLALFVFLLSLPFCYADTKTTKMTINGKKQNLLPLAIVCINPNKELHHIAQVLARDCAFTKQCKTIVRYVPHMPTQDDMKILAKERFPLAIFLNQQEDSVEWRLYDTYLMKMIKSKKQELCTSKTLVAHIIADDIWPTLTNQPGFFSTKLVYCAQDPAHQKKNKHIYIADYDGKNTRCLVNTPTINVAPRWNNDARKPLVFYSEYTNQNVRLMFCTLSGKRAIASNYDGITMLPSFSADGSKVVFCASKAKGNCQLYYCDANGTQCIVENSGHNIAPIFANDTTIFFCSDAQTNRPQIFSFDLTTQKTTPITRGGFCTSPAFCPRRNQLAYIKIVNSIAQIFVYDLAQKKHQQLTFDPNNKEECCWSPCGNFIAFALEQKSGMQAIAIQNLLTAQRTIVSPKNVVCSYPHWSPYYSRGALIDNEVDKA